jgi:hypothetical protein
MRQESPVKLPVQYATVPLSQRADPARPSAAGRQCRRTGFRVDGAQNRLQWGTNAATEFAFLPRWRHLRIRSLQQALDACESIELEGVFP